MSKHRAGRGFFAPYFLRLPKLFHTGLAALRGLSEPGAAACGLPVGVFAKQPAIMPDPISCAAKLAVMDDQRMNQMAKSRFLSSHGSPPPRSGVASQSPWWTSLGPLGDYEFFLPCLIRDATGVNPQ